MAIPTVSTSLSANDTRILQALFDPETLPSSVAKSQDASAIDTDLPPHPIISTSQLAILETQQNELVRSIDASKQGDEVSISAIDAVTEEMDAVTERYPEYPSAYVNRAMLRRMRLESTLSSNSISTTISSRDPQNKLNLFTSSPPQITPLFADLSLAIASCLPPSSSPTSPVSAYRARILRTAYSHRAYLYLKAAESGIEWQGKQKGELEELASRDFAQAARFGDEKAREMSVRTNPYAKMCGAIVREALSEEIRESGLGGYREGKI
ncbi:hypothetical protein K505DRAFT_330367 [Melanomma pulvis-pyrius CBS 109.77]|uniref:Uncharacterized protein n=1 Tax=Melanomma pulvis-pyrius CBS 109.77 TaxID=1314802 RepID=A0A6A6WR29_9PLEO|nr:hypothetical protein K505DRAFT_330367 [Melanomma pulvis-pyrius CBS 109.77]